MKLSAVLNDADAAASFDKAQIAFVLTDATRDDNPIVYVNEAFVRTTGYARSAVIGRNCRFLQGADTKKSAVDLLRSRIEARRDVSVDILNYRADGQPFKNRLLVAPIKNGVGDTRYFLGVQKNLDADESSVSRGNIDMALATLCERATADVQSILLDISEDADLGSDDEPYSAIQRRLDALQLVYEELRLSDSDPAQSGVNVGPLLTRLFHAIAHDVGPPGVKTQVSVESVEVGIDLATRIAIIFAEVVHAKLTTSFNGLAQGLLDVRLLRLAAGGFRMTIGDDGDAEQGTGGSGGASKIWPAGSPRGKLIERLVDGVAGTVNHATGIAGGVLTIEIPLTEEINAKEN
ncbi:PAS domain-containing protein [Shimia ponticola]|uniref:PAS domain-containing protein n=1 Tax=Shimia ponticola TaxID=2582893 RepID=UPI00164A6A41|nr:PAS domain-containing protein [Shimia ponticola]